MATNTYRAATSGLLAGVGAALGVKLFTAASQVAASFFLTPDDYGEVAMALLGGSVAALFGVGSWTAILLRSPGDERIRSSVRVAGMALSIVPIVAIGISWDALNALGHTPRGALLTLLVVLPVLLSPFVTIDSAGLQATLRLRKLAAIQFAEGAVSAVALVVAAMAGLGAFALATSRGIGAAFSMLLYRMTRTQQRYVRVSASEVGRVIRDGAGLSTYVAAASLVFTLPPAIVSFTNRAETTGLLAWALQFSVQLPVVLGMSARQVQMAVAAPRAGVECPQAQQSNLFPLVSAGLAIGLLQALLAPFAIPLIFANRWDPAIPAMAFLSVAQCLLPLTMVRAGQALLDGRLARTLAATGMAVAVVVVASWCGAQFATHDLEMTALYVSAGYLVGNFASWLLLAWPLGASAGREGMHALGATALGMAILPIAHWGFAGGSGQLFVWLLLWGLFAVLALVVWRRWAALTRLAQRGSETEQCMETSRFDNFHN